MELTIERISPKRAKELLSGNTMNRNLRPKVVESYARDMERGKWTDCGNPIRINCDDDLLLDGQHRLHAIIKSGKTLKMVVARGVPTTTMLNIDTGTRRSFADNLKLLGHKSVTALSAAIRWGVLYEDPECMPYRGGATHTEMMDWFLANPRIEDHVHKVMVSCLYARTHGNGTPLVMLRHYADHKDEFDVFFDSLVSGANLPDGSPILTLRNYLEHAALGEFKRPAKMLAAVTVKAWNAWIIGEELRVLKYRPGGAKAEPFPTIITGA